MLTNAPIHRAEALLMLGHQTKRELLARPPRRPRHQR
jgi:hypothetical protein